MSHDQRPTRMRVVSDAAANRGNAVPANPGGGAKQAGGKGAAETPKGLPIVLGLLFVLACGGGGVLVTMMLAGGH